MANQPKTVEIEDALYEYFCFVAELLVLGAPSTREVSEDAIADEHTTGGLVDAERRIFGFTHFPDDAEGPAESAHTPERRRWRFKLSETEIERIVREDLFQLRVVEDRVPRPPRAEKDGARAHLSTDYWRHLGQTFFRCLLEDGLIELALSTENDAEGVENLLENLIGDFDPLLEKILQAQSFVVREQVATELSDWLIERDEIDEVFGSDEEFRELIATFEARGWE